MSIKKRILITGTTGFIGSHLATILLDKGHEVYGIERYVTGRFVEGMDRRIQTFFGDLQEFFTIKNIIRQIKPQIVIHLAAVSAVSFSYEHPQEIMQNNLLGTINLAEACLREVPSFEHFLYASTSETYGNGPSPKKETTPQNPNSPYAVSKHAGEKYLLYMKDAYDFPITILRNFNTYGRKNNRHFVVERIITQMLTTDEVRLGDPTPIRDLVYVDDHVNAYITCMENKNAIGEIFNFSTGKGISIKDLVEKISKHTNYPGKIVWHTIPKRPLDIQILIGDNSKAKKILNWEPKYMLDQGLQKTIEYWKQKI
jgi:GDP-mannose 4,6-dehydratase